MAVVAGAKSGIKSLKELKGKRVGSQFGSATDYVFKSKILPKAGLSEKDVQMVNVRFQNHVAALAAGSIDAFAGVEPFVSVCEVNKLGKALTDYTPYDLEPVILAANTDLIKKNRNGVIEFLRGYLAAVKIFDDNRAEATKIVLDPFAKKGFKVDENDHQDDAVEDRRQSGLQAGVEDLPDQPVESPDEAAQDRGDPGLEQAAQSGPARRGPRQELTRAERVGR